MRLGGLEAIRSEEYATAHPEEILVYNMRESPEIAK